MPQPPLRWSPWHPEDAPKDLPIVLLARRAEWIYENLFIRRHEFSSLEALALAQLALAFETARDRDPVRHAAVAPTTGESFAMMSIPQSGPRLRDPTPPTMTPFGPRNPAISNRMISQEAEQPVDLERACSRCGEVGHFVRG